MIFMLLSCLPGDVQDRGLYLWPPPKVDQPLEADRVEAVALPQSGHHGGPLGRGVPLAVQEGGDDVREALSRFRLRHLEGLVQRHLQLVRRQLQVRDSIHLKNITKTLTNNITKFLSTKYIKKVKKPE